MAKHLRQSGTGPTTDGQGAARFASPSDGRRTPRFTPESDEQPGFGSPSKPVRRRTPRFTPGTDQPEASQPSTDLEERRAPRSTPARDIQNLPDATPGPASAMGGASPVRYDATGHEPRTWWGVLIFILAIAAILAALGWFFVLPNLGIGPQVAQPIYEEQTSRFLAQDGTQWDLTSDLRSPIELQGVSDEGVAIRFKPLTGYGNVSVHVVSCEVNGVAHDPTRDDDAIHYTIVNESTGESVETLDPLFITSGTGEGSDGTVVIVQAEGFDAAEYDSVVLGIDQQLSEETVSGTDAEDVNGLYVSVAKAG